VGEEETEDGVVVRLIILLSTHIPSDRVHKLLEVPRFPLP